MVVIRDVKEKLHTVIIIKNKDSPPSGLDNLANFSYPVYALWFTSSQRLLNYLAFQSFKFESLKVIPEITVMYTLAKIKYLSLHYGFIVMSVKTLARHECINICSAHIIDMIYLLSRKN